MFRWNIRSFTFSDEYKIIYISRQNIRSFRFSDRISDRLHCHMNTRSFIFSDGHRILTTSLYPKYLSEDFRANMKIVLGLRNPKDTAVSFFYQYKADPHENFALSWTDYIDLFSLGKGNTHTHTHTHTVTHTHTHTHTHTVTHTHTHTHIHTISPIGFRGMHWYTLGPSGHMIFIQRRFKVVVTSTLFKRHVLTGDTVLYLTIGTDRTEQTV